MLNKAIKLCPNCGSDALEYDGVKKYYCPVCSWQFYQNTAAAVAGIIEYDGKVLVVERNREPDKGLLDFPGGFVDAMETAEDALRREIKEELNIDAGELSYLCTAPNLYTYKGIEYSTCDIFYIVKVNSDNFLIDKSEIAACIWLEKQNLNPERFAFLSMKEAIHIYKNLSLNNES